MHKSKILLAPKSGVVKVSYHWGLWLLVTGREVGYFDENILHSLCAELGVEEDAGVDDLLGEDEEVEGGGQVRLVS